MNFCLALAPGVELDRRVAELGEEIASIAKSDPVAQRLQQLRGVGPVIATALVAAVGSGEQFAKGRELAVSLGLTPKQHSTGGKERLLGNQQAWRSVPAQAPRPRRSCGHPPCQGQGRLSVWVTRLAARRHINVASVALANKTARIAWSMLRKGTDYQPELAAGPTA